MRVCAQITIAIGDEVRDQNRALDMMQGGFGDTDNLIGSTMKKMQVPLPLGLFQQVRPDAALYVTMRDLPFNDANMQCATLAGYV